MQTIELFCGTKSFSKVMAQHGHSTYTIDMEASFSPDLIKNVMDLNELPFKPYVLWASPPCTCFSVASISTHWSEGKPKTDKASQAITLVDKTISIIKKAEPKYWFIENPRGMLRTVINELFYKNGITDFKRITITYCQYGDTRMKPTDIWTNIPRWQGKRCERGSACHISAPRGSKTGTQGLKTAKDRGVIPPALFEEILGFVE